MPAPHQITAYPLTVYLAPTGTAFPEIDDAEGAFDAAWITLGTEGNLDYEADGVSVGTPQTVETFTGAGSTAPRKAFRTDEGLTLGFTLVDLSPDQFALVMDDATVTTTAAGAGQAGHKAFSLKRGLDVETFALLARGQSTVNNALNLQFAWPTVFQSGEPAPQFQKGTPAGLAVEFTALEVTADNFGDIDVATAAAS